MSNIEYIKAKTIVTKTKKPSMWFGTDYNMNIYKGCCHGCIYCDSRSDCYGIEDFDTVRPKADALRIIRDDLRRKVKRGVVASGSMSDPYTPLEKKLELTRNALILCDAFEFGAAIATKSALISRDIDILKGIKEHSPVLAKITITTADDQLARLIEPGAASSSERFATIRALSDAGIFTGILLMPVLPFLEDQEENILAIIKQAHDSGAKFIYPGFGMTLRGSQKIWYYDKLTQLFPDQDLPARYEKAFGNRYQCTSPKARKLWHLFAAECRDRGILYQMDDIITAYRRPYKIEQLSLFD